MVLTNFFIKRESRFKFSFLFIITIYPNKKRHVLFLMTILLRHSVSKSKIILKIKTTKWCCEVFRTLFSCLSTLLCDSNSRNCLNYCKDPSICFYLQWLQYFSSSTNQNLPILLTFGQNEKWFTCYAHKRADITFIF